MLAVQLPESVIVLLFLPFIASGFYVYYCFDSLLRYQYQHHFKDWEKDGRPMGFFWAAPDTPIFAGVSARNQLTLTWCFCRIPWIESDENAKRLRRRYQIASLASLLASLIILGLVCWLIISSIPEVG